VCGRRGILATPSRSEDRGVGYFFRPGEGFLTSSSALSVPVEAAAVVGRRRRFWRGFHGATSRLTSADALRRLGSSPGPSERAGAHQGKSARLVRLARPGIGLAHSSPLPNDRQDSLSGSLGQHRPCVDHGHQVGVDWGRIARKCAGFCAAWGGLVARSACVISSCGNRFESCAAHFRHPCRSTTYEGFLLRNITYFRAYIQFHILFGRFFGG
jgi:hypothetical protein